MLNNLPLALPSFAALIIAAVFPCLLHAQNPTEANAELNLAPRVPGSPTAAALERYALMPVSESSGTPEITLPLLSVQSGSLSLPIGLSYHASGVRVDDEASWVGLGWSLNAGGVITRTVRGGADERASGFFEKYNQLPNPDTLNDAVHHSFFDNVARQTLDYEPDLFNFNFPGGSGAFQLGNDGAFHTFPYQPLRISYSRSNGGLDFRLTDNAGTCYDFTAREFTTSRRRGADGPRNCSAWYLTRIVSADKTDTIRLAYSAHQISYPSGYYQSLSVPWGGEMSFLCGNNALNPGPVSTSNSSNRVEAVRLQEIVFRDGRVVFGTQGSRADILSDKRLTSVALLAAGSTDTLRKVRFYHSYFNGDLPLAGQASSIPNPPRLNTEDDKLPYLRLRLDSVQTSGRGLSLPPHRFSYSPVRLPSRGKGPRDHWGYANASYRTSPAPGAAPALIHRQRVFIVPGSPGRDSNGNVEVGNTSREPAPDFVQAGLLQGITYPTGGFVRYEFEPNIVRSNEVVQQSQTTYFREVTGISRDTLVHRIDTLATGNYFQNLTATIAVTRYNEPNYQYGHHASGRIRITNLATGAEVTNLFVRPGAASSSPAGSEIIAAPLPVLAPNTRYRILLEAVGDHFSATVNLRWDSAPPQYQIVNKVHGGVRVKAIRSYTGPGAPAQTRGYSYTSPGSTLTSGYPHSPFAPTYVTEQIIRSGSYDNLSGQNGSCNQYGCRYGVVGSQAIGELSGGTVSYTCVTVADSTGPTRINGQTVSYYSGEQMRGSIHKPYYPAQDFSWRRGKLVERLTYKGDAAQSLQLVERLRNDYANFPDVSIEGFKVIADISYSGCRVPDFTNMADNAHLPHYQGRFSYGKSLQTSDWHYQTRSRHYRYPNGADTTQYALTTTTYTYGNKAHAQPTQVTSIQGRFQETVYRQFAADYDTTAASTPVARAVRAMARHQLNASPLETRTVRQQPNSPAVVVQAALQYPLLVNQGVVFHKALAWEAPQPREASQFAASQVRNGSFVADAGYREKMVVDHFDYLNRVVQYHTTAGTPVSLLWGLSKNEPLAQVQNASYDKIAATSFEPGGSGQWRYAAAGANTAVPAFTGQYSYDLGTGRVQTDGLGPGEYLVAFRWHGAGGVSINGEALPQPAGSGWRWCQRRVRLLGPGIIDITGTARIDELRLCPTDAQMTTMTYIPLVGMTSQTDPAGRTTTYEYDALGRLLRARDERGAILAQQEYHYARP